MSSYSNIIFLTSANADVKDLTKGYASWIMEPVIDFPANSDIKVAVHSFSFTNFFVNIIAGVNDVFYITDNVLLPQKYTITIPAGSYNVSDLSDAANSAIVNLGLPDGTLVIIPDFSTNKVQFNITLAGYQIYFPALSPYVLLGLNLNQKIPALGLTTGSYIELAPNVATFNSILGLYVHTNLTNSGIFNGKQSNVLYSVIPTASIGSVQNDKEYNLLWTNAKNLSGQQFNNIIVYITDQNGTPVNLSDDFSVTLLSTAN